MWGPVDGRHVDKGEVPRSSLDVQIVDAVKDFLHDIFQVLNVAVTAIIDSDEDDCRRRYKAFSQVSRFRIFKLRTICGLLR